MIDLPYPEALAEAVAGERVVIVGGPGTGKSEFADDVERLGRAVVRADDYKHLGWMLSQPIAIFKALSAQEGGYAVEGVALARVLAYWRLRPTLVVVRDTVMRELDLRARVLGMQIDTQLALARKRHADARWIRALPY